MMGFGLPFKKGSPPNEEENSDTAKIKELGYRSRIPLHRIYPSAMDNRCASARLAAEHNRLSCKGSAATSIYLT